MKTIFEVYEKKRLDKVRPYFQFFSPPAVSPFPEIAVVIPALNEFPAILETLDSLRASLAFSFPPPEPAGVPAATSCPRAAVIVAVNNRASCAPEIRANNQLTLQALAAAQRDFAALGAVLIVADFSSPGREIPAGQGVGFARKAGMDFALVSGAKLLACLDADTLCHPAYFAVLSDCIAPGREKNGDKGGKNGGVFFAGVTDFFHREAADRQTQAHIDTYETALKRHSAELFACGTPYYPVALGPTLVCSAFAYASCGGMNCRLAGEDFYFLQALIKVSPRLIERLPTAVYPSSRFSDRVPFGTGSALSSAAAGQGGFSVVFPGYCYVILQKWLAAAAGSSAETPAARLIKQAAEISSLLRAFLERESFPAVWQKIAANNRKDRVKLLKAFHVWFDGLKIIRLFHFLQQNGGEKTASVLAEK